MEIVIAGPRAYEKNEKVVSTCSSVVAAGVKALTEALDMSKAQPSTEKLQTSYEHTCAVRLRILHIWQSHEVSSIPELSSITGITSTANQGGNDGEKSASNGDGDKAPATPATDGDAAAKHAECTPEKLVPVSGANAKSSASTTSPSVSSSMKVSSILRKSLEPGAGNSAAQHVADVSHALCRAEMNDVHQSMLGCETVDDLHQQVDKLKNAAAVVKQLKDGATKAAASLKAHIQNRLKAQKRKLQQDEKQKEQVEMNARKRQAKEAALEVKKQADALSPVFTIEWGDLKNAEDILSGKAVPVFSGPAVGSITTLDTPCCIASVSAVATFMKNPKVARLFPHKSVFVI